VPRFYAAQLPAVVGGCVELEPDEAKHAVRVLRLRANDAVELCDGSGRVVRCIVIHTDKTSAAVSPACCSITRILSWTQQRVQHCWAGTGYSPNSSCPAVLQVSAVQEPQALPWVGPEWVLAVGCLTLKGGRADWLVEKATELGARSLVPLITQRSQSAGKNKFKVSTASSTDSSAAGDFNAGRLERLAVAATKQSLRAHGLQLQAPTAVEALLPLVRASPVSLLATAGAPPVVQALAAAPQPPSAWWVLAAVAFTLVSWQH
jgi:16S rRNA (uracil1498-N3)-methyltransferase